MSGMAQRNVLTQLRSTPPDESGRFFFCIRQKVGAHGAGNSVGLARRAPRGQREGSPHGLWQRLRALAAEMRKSDAQRGARDPYQSPIRRVHIEDQEDRAGNRKPSDKEGNGDDSVGMG